MLIEDNTDRLRPLPHRLGEEEPRDVAGGAGGGGED